MIFDENIFYVQMMGLWFPIDPHQVMGMKNYTYKIRKLDGAMSLEWSEENSISSDACSMRVDLESVTNEDYTRGAQ